MLFNSYVFLLVFLPLVLFFWWRPWPIPVRLAFLAGASYVFYAWWDWRFAFLMLGTTLVDYFAGRAIHQAETPTLKKRWLVASLVFNLGMLGFFKYWGFFATSANALLTSLGGPSLLPALQVVLPIGISFYIFESVTYTIDIYKGIARPAESLLHYGVFISIFPKLVAGPIIRYTDVEAQYRSLPTEVDWPLMHRGIWFFVVGLAKKLLIADLLARQIDPLFAQPASMGLASGWAALLGYSFQLYFDFSAYSDMAVGLGFMLGLRFPQNFNRPYLATNVADLWNRWHITLSRWFRDYLFIPLSRTGNPRTSAARNMIVTMTLCGLWHGASWTYVLWGLYHGLLLAGYQGWKGWSARRNAGRVSVRDWRLENGDSGGEPVSSQSPISNLQSPHPALPWASRALVFLLWCLGLVLFRNATLGAAGVHFEALVGGRGWSGSFGEANPLELWGLIACCALWVVSVPEVWDWKPAPRRRWVVALAGVTVFCILQLDKTSPFLYFQF